MHVKTSRRRQCMAVDPQGWYCWFQARREQDHRQQDSTQERGSMRSTIVGEAAMKDRMVADRSVKQQ